jgi:hypothetical protein
MGPVHAGEMAPHMGCESELLAGRGPGPLRPSARGNPSSGPPFVGMLPAMSGVRARVVQGRLVMDEPTSLPEGTILDLVMDDEGDDLPAPERAARDAALSRAWQQAQAGSGRPIADVIDELRRG